MQKKKKTVDRRFTIVQELDQNGKVDISELAKKFDVSEVTIRNDLAQLENKNVLIRARGGALKIDPVGVDHNIHEKNKINIKKKQLIGLKAAEFVNEGDTIMIDSGTTVMQLVRNLTNKVDLTVITNALNVVNQIHNNSNIQVIIPGGFLRNKSFSLIGTPAERNIRNYFCDKLFLGIDGLDVDYGLSTPNVEEAHLNGTMIEMSKQIIVLADSSKIGKRSLAFICPVSKINVLITDSGISNEQKIALESTGIMVVIA
ncbi:transcriptional repressor AgaR [Confluentibacter flavum]|uniref:DeoR/GlpR transcriptional regulator n=1 Tax=Confluentibacter flavum TaxID=1909700 RepID=A0A2N3HHH1_9FLAO|nr:transcriptional repressor AgaR [Confluentibacter flavum]PKQ44420.1 DeoR/GlpR transcriptional regulator [Confluentibacter flavum]